MLAHAQDGALPMNHSLLASTALSAVFVSGALAADLPTMKGPPPAPTAVVAQGNRVKEFMLR
jgi:hypothetical protein